MVGGVFSRLWTDCCTVIVREPVTGEDGVTRLKEVIRCEGQPCRLSFFQSVRYHAEEALGGAAAKVEQAAKLILPPDVEVPPGSRIRIRRGDKTMDFCASGMPMRFHAHQEIILENFEKWA